MNECELNHVNCRQCGSQLLKNRGEMIQADTFGGVSLPSIWEGGRLYECKHCYLVFRHPVRDQSEYLSLYEMAPEDTYRNDSLRHDQRLVRDVIVRHCAGGTILDVGCFDGALLNSLNSQFKKFGIEAAKAAIEVCKKTGIEIIAESADGLKAIDQKFDVICAVDVVEHLISPKQFFDDLSASLKPGGLLVISTGNASNKVWKIFGGRYWYCAFPEHISFISSEWVHKVAPDCSLNVLELSFFQHENTNISKTGAFIRFVGRLVRAYLESLSFVLKGKKMRNPKYKLGFPGVFRDHLLVVLQRK